MATLPATGTEISMGQVYVFFGLAPGYPPDVNTNIKLSGTLGPQIGKTSGNTTSLSADFGGLSNDETTFENVEIASSTEVTYYRADGSIYTKLNVFGYEITGSHGNTTPDYENTNNTVTTTPTTEYIELLELNASNEVAFQYYTDPPSTEKVVIWRKTFGVWAEFN